MSEDSLKVSMANIQAIETAEIEIEGLTGLVGRSNIGKSAFIRGLDAALSNKVPKSLFRHGTKESKVTVVDESRGINIEWRKNESNSINEYTINGEKHTKVGKEPQKQIIDWGFQNVKVGDKNLDVQFAKQFKALFLLEESGGYVADFISKITKADILTGAMKDCESDDRKARDSIKHTEKDVEKITKDLTRFSDLDFYQERIRNFVEDKNTLLKSSGDIEALNKDIENLESLAGEVSKLKELPEAPEVSFEISELVQVDDWVSEIKVSKEHYLEVKKVDDISLPELAFDVEVLKDMEAYLSLESKVNYETPEIPEFEFDLTEFMALDETITELRAVATESSQIDKQLKEASEKFEQCEKDLKKFERDVGHCPMCKSEFKVSGKHVHDSVSEAIQ